MDILSELFGGVLRVKIMRQFLFNPETAYDIDRLGDKIGARKREIERELSVFRKIGLVKQVKIIRIVEEKKRGVIKRKKLKLRAWTLDPKFRFAKELTDFLVSTHPLEHKSIVRRIEKAGRIKAVLVAGIFTGDPESRLDLFVVGDNVRSSSMERIVRALESDMGKDIRYAVLSAPDYAYRLSMNDKLVRDVIDFPHTVLLDKIGVSPNK